MAHHARSQSPHLGERMGLVLCLWLMVIPAASAVETTLECTASPAPELAFGNFNPETAPRTEQSDDLHLPWRINVPKAGTWHLVLQSAAEFYLRVWHRTMNEEWVSATRGWAEFIESQSQYRYRFSITRAEGGPSRWLVHYLPKPGTEGERRLHRALLVWVNERCGDAVRSRWSEPAQSPVNGECPNGLVMRAGECTEL